MSEEEKKAVEIKEKIEQDNKKMLDDLINETEERMRVRDLSDEYLKEHGCSTRDDIGIGEYAYGITMIPCEWVYPFLLDLQSKNNLIEKQQEQLQEKDKIIDTIVADIEEHMSEEVCNYLYICDECKSNNEDCHGDYCKETIIEYFTKKAREV